MASCSVFLLADRPRRRSTLFPYTALFRSGGVARVRAHGLRGRGRAAPARRRLRDERAQDRKSTRLNSSHSQNSYAVFCLKKKTLWTHSFRSIKKIRKQLASWQTSRTLEYN